MKKVFMVHGFMGEPNGGWRPWLMGELAKEGVYACALPMPTPNDPIKAEWVKSITYAVQNSKEDQVFLVGHSLGVPAILRYLESLSENQKISGAVLISGPANVINPDNKESKLRKIDHFLEIPFNFEHIKKVCEKFTIIHGENDDKVPFSHGEELSRSLDCKIISIPNGGHLGGSDGFRQLPQALSALKEMLN